MRRIAMARVVVVTGVSGAGKTTFRSRLARSMYGALSIGMSDIVLLNGCWTRYDSSFRSFVADQDCVCRAVKRLARRWNVLLVEANWLGWIDCISNEGIGVEVWLVRAKPQVVYKRLLQRGWPIEKVVDNVAAELIGVLAAETLAQLEKRSVSRVREVVSSERGKFTLRQTCCIDWLEILSEKEVTSIVRLIERHGFVQRGGVSWSKAWRA